MKFNKIFVAAAVAVIAAGCVKEQVGDIDLPVEEEVVVVADAPKLFAELDEPETRTCIDADANATGKLSMLWTPSDEVGVFTSGGDKNVKYVNDEQSVNVPNASFSATAPVNGNIQYVYYPYSSANNGKEATALSGTVPAEQVMGQSITGDYKYGTLKSVTEDGGYKFKFNNMFSLVRFNIDATGTALADATLETVTLTVTRDGAAVPVAGDFTFSAVDGTYTPGATSDVLTTVWNKPLQGNQSSYASVFPNVKKGDKLNFVIKAGDFESTLTVTATADFAAGKYYNFPLTLSKFSALKIQKTIRGNFTAGTLNVDGLPDLTIVDLWLYKKTLNPDGPGASGTLTIGNLIKQLKWDIVGFSEDFEHHSKLEESMSGYTFGKHRGTITKSALTNRADTDGLEFAVRNDFGERLSEGMTQFGDEAGDALAGANTCIKKGFRHYEVKVKDQNVILDVIITHMNTYSDDGRHKEAQHNQLIQIAEYINTITAKNKRPVILMGDTNCRYTRHDFNTNFFSKLNKDITYSDPWVAFHRNNIYPGSGRSYMILSKFAGDKENDICCCDDQRGEVVDKIIYFNVKDANIQLKALECYNDVANFTKTTESATYSGVMTEDANGNIYENQKISITKNVGYADHFPVVAKFSYEGVVDVK